MVELSDKWLLKMAEREGDSEIGAGAIARDPTPSSDWVFNDDDPTDPRWMYEPANLKSDVVEIITDDAPVHEIIIVIKSHGGRYRRDYEYIGKLPEAKAHAEKMYWHHINNDIGES